MLLSDIANRHIFSMAVTDRDPEYPLGQIDPFGMMTERSMAKIGQHRFRFIKPLVKG